MGRNASSFFELRFEIEMSKRPSIIYSFTTYLSKKQ